MTLLMKIMLSAVWIGIVSFSILAVFLPLKEFSGKELQGVVYQLDLVVDVFVAVLFCLPYHAHIVLLYILFVFACCPRFPMPVFLLCKMILLSVFREEINLKSLSGIILAHLFFRHK